LDCPKPLIQWRGSLTHFAQKDFLGFGFDLDASNFLVTTAIRRPCRMT